MLYYYKFNIKAFERSHDPQLSFTKVTKGNAEGKNALRRQNRKRIADDVVLRQAQYKLSLKEDLRSRH